MMHIAGVPQRIAQEAMWHSSAELTNDIYTDRNLLAVGSAIDSLPSLMPGTKQAQGGIKQALIWGKQALKQAQIEGEKDMQNGKNNEAVNGLNLEKSPETLGKNETESPILEALRILKEWCTGMESNHHAIAGTRT